MARIRYLKMGFFENEELSSLSAYHRLCFAGLWLLADREGRIEDRPKRIHAKLFPYETSLDVAALLHDLAVLGFITRYIIGDVRVIQVVHFIEHQRPRNDEQPSKLPAQPTDALGRTLSADVSVVSPISSPVNIRPPEDEHQQPLTGPVTEVPRNSEQSPQGIGIGIGIGIGTGGPPAPAAPWQTAPLIPRGGHRNHAFCGKVCFPAALLEQFTARLGHLSESDGYAYVSRFFDDWNARYTSGDRAGVVVGEDGFDFWRDRWKESHPPAPKTASRRSGQFLTDVQDLPVNIVQPGKRA